MKVNGTRQGSSNRSEAAERDHRISNSLSIISGLVSLKAKHAKVGDVRRTLLDVAARIETVARLHRVLAYAETPAVPIGKFLLDVCAAMKSIAEDDDRLRVTVDCPHELMLPPDMALRLGLLTTELFSNSVKYAHPTGIPTLIRVTCRNENGTVVFAFEDDGIGFPEDFDPKRDDGLGMRILHSVSAQLNGVHEWQDSGTGLRFQCCFPIVALPVENG
jgi:two-component sensor histidine kinase